MHDAILRRMRTDVRSRRYNLTLHAKDEMREDGFAIHDVERGMLTGAIRERQRDRMTGELKYVILGRAVDERGIGIVAKYGPTGMLAVLTVFADEE